MARTRESQEMQILRWFRTAPIGGAALVLGLVQGEMKERRGALQEMQEMARQEKMAAKRVAPPKTPPPPTPGAPQATQTPQAGKRAKLSPAARKRLSEKLKAYHAKRKKAAAQAAHPPRNWTAGGRKKSHHARKQSRDAQPQEGHGASGAAGEAGEAGEVESFDQIENELI